ncbi:MAG TPA: hypothetical protein VEF33_11025 [Syntrophales bacterium]|nr:hypothetical protein [Syntrophales bacterium]
MKKIIFFVLCLGVCLAVYETDSWGVEVKGNNNKWTFIGSVQQSSVLKINASGKVDFGCKFGECKDTAVAGFTGSFLGFQSSDDSSMGVMMKTAETEIFFETFEFAMKIAYQQNNPCLAYQTAINYFGKTQSPNYDQGGVWIKVVKKTGSPYIGTQLYYFWAVQHGINEFGLAINEDVDVYAKAHDGGRSRDATKSYGDNKGSYQVTIASSSFPVAQLPTAEDCVSFNPVTMMVKQIQNSWKIVDGTIWMFDFGTNKLAADRALMIMKFYKMNSSCYVGRPQPSFSYLLAGTNAPIGTMSGEDCIRFNPATAQIKEVNCHYKIVEDNTWLNDFGSIAEANKALSIIKKYGFTNQCFVSRPNPAFQYLHK